MLPTCCTGEVVIPPVVETAASNARSAAEVAKKIEATKQGCTNGRYHGQVDANGKKEGMMIIMHVFFP